MKIALGSDHAGYNYKEKIKKYLKESGHEPVDFGTNSAESVDYPMFIRPVAEAVARGEFERGIVLGGSGNGEAIVANRIPGIRCALCWNVESARLARSHNDANMISLGERLISLESAIAIVEVWLKTLFEGGRHSRRLDQIDRGIKLEGPSISRSKSGKSSGREEIPDFEIVQEITGAKEWDFLIAFRYLKYIEGERSIEFRVDPGLKSPTVIYVPSHETWDKEMPDWAKERREEILGRIKPKCEHIKPEWKEY